MSKLSVVGYARCSTAEQAEEGLSIEAQRSRVLAYAALYELDLVAWETDAGVSAKSFGSLDATLQQRPGLARALRVLDRGDASGVVVAKLDRLSRSVTDLDLLVRGYFADRHVLLSVGDQIDTRSASGRMVLNVLASVAQGERETIGERTAAALALKRASSEFTGGEAPYGWALGADGVHLQIHRGEQHAIQRALAWRAMGSRCARWGRRSKPRAISRVAVAAGTPRRCAPCSVARRRSVRQDGSPPAGPRSRTRSRSHPQSSTVR